jgi:hypothetical protein
MSMKCWRYFALANLQKILCEMVDYLIFDLFCLSQQFLRRRLPKQFLLSAF